MSLGTGEWSAARRAFASAVRREPRCALKREGGCVPRTPLEHRGNLLPLSGFKPRTVQPVICAHRPIPVPNEMAFFPRPLEVLKSVLMKIQVFWDVTPCWRVKGRRFGGGGAYLVRLQVLSRCCYAVNLLARQRPSRVKRQFIVNCTGVNVAYSALYLHCPPYIFVKWSMIQLYEVNVFLWFFVCINWCQEWFGISRSV